MTKKKTPDPGKTTHLTTQKHHELLKEHLKNTSTAEKPSESTENADFQTDTEETRKTTNDEENEMEIDNRAGPTKKQSKSTPTDNAKEDDEEEEDGEITEMTELIPTSKTTKKKFQTATNDAQTQKITQTQPNKPTKFDEKEIHDKKKSMEDDAADFDEEEEETDDDDNDDDEKNSATYANDIEMEKNLTSFAISINTTVQTAVDKKNGTLTSHADLINTSLKAFSKFLKGPIFDVKGQIIESEEKEGYFLSTKDLSKHSPPERLSEKSTFVAYRFQTDGEFVEDYLNKFRKNLPFSISMYSTFEGTALRARVGTWFHMSPEADLEDVSAQIITILKSAKLKEAATAIRSRQRLPFEGEIPPFALEENLLKNPESKKGTDKTEKIRIVDLLCAPQHKVMLCAQIVAALGRNNKCFGNWEFVLLENESRKFQIKRFKEQKNFLKSKRTVTIEQLPDRALEMKVDGKSLRDHMISTVAWEVTAHPTLVDTQVVTVFGREQSAVIRYVESFFQIHFQALVSRDISLNFCTPQVPGADSIRERDEMKAYGAAIKNAWAKPLPVTTPTTTNKEDTAKENASQDEWTVVTNNKNSQPKVAPGQDSTDKSREDALKKLKTARQGLINKQGTPVGPSIRKNYEENAEEREQEMFLADKTNIEAGTEAAEISRGQSSVSVATESDKNITDSTLDQVAAEAAAASEEAIEAEDKLRSLETVRQAATEKSKRKAKKKSGRSESTTTTLPKKSVEDPSNEQPDKETISVSALMREISLLRKEMQEIKTAMHEQAAEEATQRASAMDSIQQDFAEARQHADCIHEATLENIESSEVGIVSINNIAKKVREVLTPILETQLAAVQKSLDVQSIAESTAKLMTTVVHELAEHLSNRLEDQMGKITEMAQNMSDSNQLLHSRVAKELVEFKTPKQASRALFDDNVNSPIPFSPEEEKSVEAKKDNGKRQQQVQCSPEFQKKIESAGVSLSVLLKKKPTKTIHSPKTRRAKAKAKMAAETNADDLTPQSSEAPSEYSNDTSTPNKPTFNPNNSHISNPNSSLSPPSSPSSGRKAGRKL